MKTTFKYLASVVLTAIFSFAMHSVTFAQRGGGHGGGGGGGFHGGGGGGGFHNGGSFGGGYHSAPAPRANVQGHVNQGVSSYQQRATVTNNYRNNYSYGNRSGVSVGYRGGYPGGYRGAAYFHGGYYNRFYAPRIGFRINVLPYGYYPFYWGDDQFYYDNGLFYQQYDNSSYSVVAPPMGAILPNVPQDAKSITIDGVQYYENNGVYYQPVTNNDGTTGYKIVGKDGELNTDQSNSDQQDNNNNTAYPPSN